MFSFGRDKPIVTSAIPLDAIVCFCWGEIDCRCHVFNHPPWTVCIDNLVDNYLKAIEANIVGRKKEDVWIFNVVPAPKRNKVPSENPGFPFCGSDEERRGFVRHMNHKLSQSPYTFVDIHEKYEDKEGYLNMAMSDGHVHLADEKPLKEWIDAHT